MQPAAFGKTLYLWERFWTETSSDDAIRGWIDALAKFIRARTEALPTPDSEPDVL